MERGDGAVAARPAVVAEDAPGAPLAAAVEPVGLPPRREAAPLQEAQARGLAGRSQGAEVRIALRDAGREGLELDAAIDGVLRPADPARAAVLAGRLGAEVLDEALPVGRGRAGVALDDDGGLGSDSLQVSIWARPVYLPLVPNGKLSAWALSTGTEALVPRELIP